MQRRDWYKRKEELISNHDLLLHHQCQQRRSEWQHLIYSVGERVLIVGQGRVLVQSFSSGLWGSSQQPATYSLKHSSPSAVNRETVRANGQKRYDCVGSAKLHLTSSAAGHKSRMAAASPSPAAESQWDGELCDNTCFLLGWTRVKQLKVTCLKSKIAPVHPLSQWFKGNSLSINVQVIHEEFHLLWVTHMWQERLWKIEWQHKNRFLQWIHKICWKMAK